MEIIEKVKEIYPIHGFNKTKKILKIGDKRLRKIIIEYKLEKNSKVKMDFFDKNFIYLLGLIWADGYLGKKSYTIYIECAKEDMVKFKPILESISSWSFYERKREYKSTINAYLTDKKFYNILVDNDYQYKSKYSPIKIYSKIPDMMKKYFLLGIIDGDGCFYHNKKRYVRQFIITSSFEQDWSLFETILNDINVKHSTIRRNNKKSGYSQLRVTNKKDLIKVGEYIYDEMIVLDRKYESWRLTIS
jgi:hypothetical protein